MYPRSKLDQGYPFGKVEWLVVRRQHFKIRSDIMDSLLTMFPYVLPISLQSCFIWFIPLLNFPATQPAQPSREKHFEVQKIPATP